MMAAKMNEFSNFFSEFGNPVVGERFIGRRQEVSHLRNRILSTTGYGSAVVIGLPRVGKTSLVYEALRVDARRFSELRAVVVRFDVGVYGSLDGFFRALIQVIAAEVSVRGYLGPGILAATEKALQANSITFNEVSAVFKQLRREGIRLVCVLDEFDAGRYLFSGSPQVFHWFRELFSNPDFKGAFVLVCKRDLGEVARISGHESNYWANVLMKIHLKVFSEQEVDDFVRLVGLHGVGIDACVRAALGRVAGMHPYLLDAFAYHAVEATNGGERLDRGSVDHLIGSLALDYFDQIIGVLRDGPMLKRLAAIVIGPSIDVDSRDVNRFLDYGVLKTVSNNRVETFSSLFREYLEFTENPAEIWSLWADTEIALRAALLDLLENEYGAEWPATIRRCRPTLGPTLDDLQARKAKDDLAFGSRSSKNLLAYSYPRQLYDIMVVNWQKLAEPFLGKDKALWSSKFSLLSKVRTPIAHNRLEVLAPSDISQATGFCEEIYDRIARWRIGG